MTSLHPYLTDPHPKSVVQPWLIAELKELKVDELPPRYPYSVRKTRSYHHVPYLEFHGLGTPLNLDVGRGGDVYIDLTPGAHALWGHTAQGWKRWCDIGESWAQASNTDWAVIHPLFSRILWISVRSHTHRIGWFKDGRNECLATRLWAGERGLVKMPAVGMRKEVQTAYSEAAAILANLDILNNAAKILAFIVPSSAGPSAHVPEKKFGRIILESVSETLGYSMIYTRPPSWSPPPTELDIESEDDIAIIQHPYAINPPPVSHVQPQLKAKLKEILVAVLPSQYPFHLEPVKGRYRIPYFQFSDRGPPAEDLDVGTEGDVYLDLTPGAYNLYGKTANGWQRWSDPNESLPSRKGPGGQWPDGDWVVKHPHLEDYALWVVLSRTGRTTGHISWYRGTSSARESRVTANKKGLIRGDEATILAYVVDGQKPEEDRISPPEKLLLKRHGSPEASSSKMKYVEHEFSLNSDEELGPFSMRF